MLRLGEFGRINGPVKGKGNQHRLQSSSGSNGIEERPRIVTHAASMKTSKKKLAREATVLGREKTFMLVWALSKVLMVV